MEYLGTLRREFARVENSAVSDVLKIYKMPYDTSIYERLLETMNERRLKLAEAFVKVLNTGYVLGKWYFHSAYKEYATRKAKELAKKNKRRGRRAFTDKLLTVKLDDAWTTEWIEYDATYFNRDTIKMIKDVWKISAESVDRFFQIPNFLRESWYRYAFQLAGSFDTNFLMRVQSAFNDAVREGMSEKDIAKHIKKVANNFTKSRAQAIARTESTRAFNTGVLYEGLNTELVDGFRYDAVLDEKTTDICRARDGKFIPIHDTEKLAENTPPLHVNCRSMLVPVFDFDEKPQTLPKEVMQKFPAKIREYDKKFVRDFVEQWSFYRQAAFPQEAVGGFEFVYSQAKPEERFENTIKRVTEIIKNRGWDKPLRRNLNRREVLELMRSLYPDIPDAVDGVFDYKIWKAAGRRAGAEQAILLQSDTKVHLVRLNMWIKNKLDNICTYIHESIHAVRDIGCWRKNKFGCSSTIHRELEEGTTDLFAQLLTELSTGDLDYKTGYTSEVLLALVNGYEWAKQNKKSFSEWLKRMWYARNNHSYDEWKDFGLWLVDNNWNNDAARKLYKMMKEWYDTNPVEFKTLISTVSTRAYGTNQIAEIVINRITDPAYTESDFVILMTNPSLRRVVARALIKRFAREFAE